MPEPYLSEIRLFSFDFVPAGWARCDGQVLLINDYAELFTVILDTYGGDGQRTFALPDLRGRSPLHAGRGGYAFDAALGQAGGEKSHALSTAELPAHTHSVSAAPVATEMRPNGALLSSPAKPAFAAPSTGTVLMSAQSVASTGRGQPHDNMPPFLTLNFCMAVSGLYPAHE